MHSAAVLVSGLRARLDPGDGGAPSGGGNEGGRGAVAIAVAAAVATAAAAAAAAHSSSCGGHPFFVVIEGGLAEEMICRG